MRPCPRPAPLAGFSVLRHYDVKAGPLRSYDVCVPLTAGFIDMTWESFLFFVRSETPSLELIITFPGLAAIILGVPRLAGIKWSYWIVTRDLLLLALFAVLALLLLRLEPQRHWIQEAVNWLRNLFYSGC